MDLKLITLILTLAIPFMLSMLLLLSFWLTMSFFPLKTCPERSKVQISAAWAINWTAYFILVVAVLNIFPLDKTGAIISAFSIMGVAGVLKTLEQIQMERNPYTWWLKWVCL